MTGAAGIGCHRRNLVCIGARHRTPRGVLAIMTSRAIGVGSYVLVCELGRFPGIGRVAGITGRVIGRRNVGRGFALGVGAVMAIRTGFSGCLACIVRERGWQPAAGGVADITLHTCHRNMLCRDTLGIGTVMTGAAVIRGTDLRVIKRSRQPACRRVAGITLRRRLDMLGGFVGCICRCVASITLTRDIRRVNETGRQPSRSRFMAGVALRCRENVACGLSGRVLAVAVTTSSGRWRIQRRMVDAGRDPCGGLVATSAILVRLDMERRLAHLIGIVVAGRAVLRQVRMAEQSRRPSLCLMANPAILGSRNVRG